MCKKIIYFAYLLVLFTTSHAFAFEVDQALTVYWIESLEPITESNVQSTRINLNDGSTWISGPLWNSIVSEWQPNDKIVMSWFTDTMMNRGEESPLLFNLKREELLPAKIGATPNLKRDWAFRITAINVESYMITVADAFGSWFTLPVYGDSNIELIQLGDPATILQSPTHENNIYPYGLIIYGQQEIIFYFQPSPIELNGKSEA